MEDLSKVTFTQKKNTRKHIKLSNIRCTCQKCKLLYPQHVSKFISSHFQLIVLKHVLERFSARTLDDDFLTHCCTAFIKTTYRARSHFSLSFGSFLGHINVLVLLIAKTNQLYNAQRPHARLPAMLSNNFVPSPVRELEHVPEIKRSSTSFNSR